MTHFQKNYINVYRAIIAGQRIWQRHRKEEAAEGFMAVTIQQIAERAGVSRGTVDRA